MKALVALLALLFVLAACTESPARTETPPTPAPEPTPSTPTGSATSDTPATPPADDLDTQTDDAMIREFEITSNQFSFAPQTITVKKGTEVTFTLSTDDVPHGIAIPEFGVNLKVAEGERKSTTFTADKAGTYEFYCNVPCGSGHRQMKGTLIVED